MHVRRRARPRRQPPSGNRRPRGVLVAGHGVLAVGAQVVEAVGEPGADVADDLARQLVAAGAPARPTAARRSPSPASPRCGSAVRGGVRGSSVPWARNTGMPASSPRVIGMPDVERQRAVEQHAARPAVRLGEHQRARDRHALAEAQSRITGRSGIALGVEPPRGTTPPRPRGSPGRDGRVRRRVPAEAGVAHDRRAHGDVGDRPVREPRRDLDHGVLAGAVAVEGDDERRRRMRRAPPGDHGTVVRRHAPECRSSRRIGGSRCVRTRHSACRGAGLTLLGVSCNRFVICS